MSALDFDFLYDMVNAGHYDAVIAQLAPQLEKTKPDVQALYLAALCALKTGQQATANKIIRQADLDYPEILDFDFMRPRLFREGKTTNFAIWQNRLNQYRTITALDGVVISYPKCGRTWLRAMLGYYLLGGCQGNPLETLAISRNAPGLPTLSFSHDDYPHWKPYTDLHLTKDAYKNTKVAYLVRDPRDTMVSYFFQYTKRGDKELAQDPYFDGNMSAFLRHDIGGLKSIVGFYNVWAANRAVPRAFALFLYEDFHADPETEFRRLLTFLDVPIGDQAAVDAAIQFAAFDNMKKLEATDALKNARLRPPDDGDPEGFKVRRGKIGGYTDYLTGDDIAFMNEYITSELDDYYAFYK